MEVDYAIGRDIQWSDIGNISGTLQEWCDSCETVLSCIEKQIERANTEKARRSKHKETIEQEVSAFDAQIDFYYNLLTFLPGLRKFSVQSNPLSHHTFPGCHEVSQHCFWSGEVTFRPHSHQFTILSFSSFHVASLHIHDIKGKPVASVLNGAQILSEVDIFWCFSPLSL